MYVYFLYQDIKEITVGSVCSFVFKTKNDEVHALCYCFKNAQYFNLVDYFYCLFFFPNVKLWIASLQIDFTSPSFIDKLFGK